MKPSFVIPLLIVALAGAGFGWWINTPQYAVQQAAHAIKAHDVDTFHNWVDVHSVAAGAVDDMMTEPMRRIGGSELLARIIGLSILRVFKPVAVESVADKIDNWVAYHGTRTDSNNNNNNNNQDQANNKSDYSGGSPYGAKSQSNSSNDSTSNSDDNDDDDSALPRSGILGALKALVHPPNLKQIFREYGLTKKNYKGLGQTDSQGNTAHVGLKFFSPKLNHDVEVVLELYHGQGHWQVTRIANLQTFLSNLSAADKPGLSSP